MTKYPWIFLISAVLPFTKQTLFFRLFRLEWLCEFDLNETSLTGLQDIHICSLFLYLYCQSSSSVESDHKIFSSFQLNHYYAFKNIIYLFL